VNNELGRMWTFNCCAAHALPLVRYEYLYAIFEVFTTVKVQVEVFWLVTPCSDVDLNRCIKLMAQNTQKPDRTGNHIVSAEYTCIFYLNILILYSQRKLLPIKLIN